MAGPRDEIPAGGPGRLRAGHADRERTVSVLKTAFVQGRLTQDEFGLRVGQALVSRTCADLSAVTADLPPGLAPAAAPAPARDTANRTVVKVIAYMTAVWVGFWGVIAAMDPAGLHSLPSDLFLGFVMLTFLPGSPAALLMFHSWLEKRAVRSTPPGRPVAS